MDKKTLDKMRFIIPGIIISVTIYYIIYGTKNFSGNPLDNYLFYVISIICSVFYYAFNIRDFIWRKIDKTFFIQYITNSLEKIRNDETIPTIDIRKLYKERHVSPGKSSSKERSVFFELIDDKKALKEKSYQIMLNGCILSSVIDLWIIGFIVVFLEIIFLHIDFLYDRTMLIVCTFVVTIVPLIIYLLIKKHLILINSQMRVVKKDWLDNHDKKDSENTN